jgi:hypothetical protein
VNGALLLGAKSRQEVAFHYAAALCSLTGVEMPDQKLPPFFRLGEHSPPEERQAAFRELCDLTGMKAD